MKKILLLIILISNQVFSQDTKYHNISSAFIAGEYYYMFGDDVKFRESPNANSKVIELLKIGAEVQILNKSDRTLDYNGIEFPFYKVKYENKIGYVFGGLISLEKKDWNNSSFFFVLKKDSEKLFLITKNCAEIQVNIPLFSYHFSFENPVILLRGCSKEKFIPLVHSCNLNHT